MGRYVRPVLRHLAAHPDVTLTLLVRDPRGARDYRALIDGRANVAPLSAARTRGAFDRVWYPWNGMRFRSSAPALVTINDDFAFAYPARGWVARWREQRPIRVAVRDAAHILTISTWSRNALIERFGLRPDRISILPLAPDAMFSPGGETSPFSEPFILAVGTGEARKNIAFLVDAVTRAFPRGDVRLVLAGSLDDALQAQVSRTRLPLTTLTNIDDEHLRRLYRTAAVVAVPSLAEGFGLVAVEAQACGAVVIAANASALPEAVGEAGMLVDPHDVRAWCAALRALVHNTELRARYRALASARWTPASREGTRNALLAALERTIDNGT